MPSPFPGMNPYIEQADLWKDFHDTFIPAAREVLAAMVRPRYYVRIEEHLVIHEPTDGDETTQLAARTDAHRLARGVARRSIGCEVCRHRR